MDMPPARPDDGTKRDAQHIKVHGDSRKPAAEAQRGFEGSQLEQITG